VSRKTGAGLALLAAAAGACAAPATVALSAAPEPAVQAPAAPPIAGVAAGQGSRCWIQGIGDPFQDKGPIEVFADPEGREAVARIFEPAYVSAEWRRLPAPAGGLARLEIKAGISLQGFARTDGWRYWMTHDEAVVGEHVVVPAYARARLLGAEGEGRVRVRVDTRSWSPRPRAC